MDAASLAQTVVACLVPCLPFLYKMGESAAAEAMKKVGADTWERAKSLWGKLSTHPKVKEAADEIAADPDEPLLRPGLELQIRKALAADATLAEELRKTLTAAGGHPAGVTVNASGERSVAVGGSVTGGSITTGDQSGSRRSPSKP